MFGLFEFNFMLFGLGNASQTYQRFVEQIIRGLNFIYAHIDDFRIASITETKEHLKLLLERLNQYGIMINPAKCVFGVYEITFLGYTRQNHSKLL